MTIADVATFHAQLVALGHAPPLALESGEVEDASWEATSEGDS